MDYNFDNIDDLRRDRRIEGEDGISLKIKDGIYLQVRAASDANPAWREKAPRAFAEIRRLRNAGVPEGQIAEKLATLFADTLVFGWHGGVAADGSLLPGGPTIGGTPIAFSRPACIAFLLAADDAVTAIETYCIDTKNFRADRAERIVEQAKN